MNLLLLFETIKFHRVKQESAVRTLFLVCYLINIGVYFFPGSDPDLTGLLDAMQSISQGVMTTPVLTSGNLLFIGLSTAAALLTLLCTYTYAALFAGEREEKSTQEIMASLFKAMPSLVLCGILLIVPALFSVFLMFIPMLVILTALYFLPLNLILGRKRLTEAMASSVKDTRHAKMIILLQYLMLLIMMNLPETLLINMLPVTGLATALIAAFFVAAKAMMRGRLMGIFYLNLVKKVPIVIPSKPTV